MTEITEDDELLLATLREPKTKQDAALQEKNVLIDALWEKVSALIVERNTLQQLLREERERHG